MPNDKKYYLPEYVRFSRIDDERGVLSAPIAKHVLEGDSVALVAEAVPLLRKGITVSELSEELQTSTKTAEQLLKHLNETDLVRYQPDVDIDLLNWASGRPRDAKNELANYNLALVTTNELTTEPPDSLMSLVNISSVSSPSDLIENTETPDLVITVASGEDPEFHQAILSKTWSNGIPWLPLRLADSIIKLGPYTPPGSGACYNCYYKRLLASAADLEIARQEHKQNENRLFPDVIDSLIWSIAHIELVSIVAPDREPEAGGAVVAVDPLNMDTTKTDVIKLPGCEICGTN